MFTSRLNKLFALKDLGDLKFFLGIEAVRDETGFYLSQKKYIEDLLRKYNMAECKPCPTPMTTGKSLSAFEGDPMTNPTLYRSILGVL
jgi:hypothetical protein